MYAATFSQSRTRRSSTRRTNDQSKSLIDGPSRRVILSVPSMLGCRRRG